MHGDAGADPIEVAVESMSTRNLERSEPDLPQEPRRREFLLQAPDMQDPYGVGAPLHRSVQRNAVHQTTVEEVFVADSHGWEHSWQRARCQHRLDQVS